jgi:hypothetical protein
MTADDRRPGVGTGAASDPRRPNLKSASTLPPAPRRRRHLRVEFETAYTAFAFGGRDIRDALHVLTGRRPVWAGITRAWCCSERTARQLVAWAEHQGYDVEVTRPPSARPVVPTTPHTPEPADGLLW